MGIFSHLKNVVSGNILKQNQLLADNVGRILKNIEDIPDGNFVKEFVFHSTASIDPFLKHIDITL